MSCEYYTLHVAPTFQKFLERDNRLDVINLTKVNKDTIQVVGNKSAPVHPQLYKWVTWFPSFIIVTAQSWKNHNSKLEGEIFGGVINPTTGNPSEVAGEYMIQNEDALVGWVSKTLNKMASSSNGKLRKKDVGMPVAGTAAVSTDAFVEEVDYRYSESKTSPNR